METPGCGCTQKSDLTACRIDRRAGAVPVAMAVWDMPMTEVEPGMPDSWADSCDSMPILLGPPPTPPTGTTCMASTNFECGCIEKNA